MADTNNSSQTYFRFLDLPPEIRIMIYKLAIPSNATFARLFDEKYPLPPRDKTSPSLIRVSHLIHSETIPIFYAFNQFKIATELSGKGDAFKLQLMTTRFEATTGLDLFNLKGAPFKLAHDFVFFISVRWEKYPCGCSPAILLKMRVEGKLVSGGMEGYGHSRIFCPTRTFSSGLEAGKAQEVVNLYYQIGRAIERARKGIQVKELKHGLPA